MTKIGIYYKGRSYQRLKVYFCVYYETISKKYLTFLINCRICSWYCHTQLTLQMLILRRKISISSEPNIFYPMFFTWGRKYLAQVAIIGWSIRHESKCSVVQATRVWDIFFLNLSVKSTSCCLCVINMLNVHLQKTYLSLVRASDLIGGVATYISNINICPSNQKPLEPTGMCVTIMITCH